jgi:hypothetical protein
MNRYYLDHKFGGANGVIYYHTDTSEELIEKFSELEVKTWADKENKTGWELHDMNGGEPIDDSGNIDFQAWFHVEFLTSPSLVMEFLTYKLNQK